MLGYCLMSNHVHLVVVPARPDSLPLAMKRTHGRYAAYFNSTHASSGHVWQGRYYSCPLDEPHVWTALRYTELNPVRAGMVTRPEEYRWSSAAVHCMPSEDSLVSLTCWQAAWTPSTWRAYLDSASSDADAEEIRRSTHTGRPPGSPEFVRELATALKRRLAPEIGGRPRKQPHDGRQIALGFSQP
jgi:putative transposase